MTSKVNAGLASDLSSLIKTLGKGIDKLFDKMSRVDTNTGEPVTLEKVEEDGNKSTRIYSDGSKDVMELIGDYKEGNSMWKLTVIKPDGKEFEADYVHDNDIEKSLAKLYKEAYGDVKSGNTLQVGLKKVTSGKDIEIKLTSIYANYDVVEAMGVLDEVLDSDEMLDAITEDEISFEIMEDGDDYEVNEIACVDADEQLCNLFCCAVSLTNDIQYVHYNARGNNFMQIHTQMDQLGWTIQGEVDYFGELCMELCGYVPHPGAAQYPESCLYTDCGYDLDSAYSIICERIGWYIESLEACYVNFSHDIQSKLDDSIRSWRKEKDYLMSRALKE